MRRDIVYICVAEKLSRILLNKKLLSKFELYAKWLEDFVIEMTND